MHYALETGTLTAIVGASDTLVEFESLIKNTDSTIYAPETLGLKSAELVSLMDMLTDDEYNGFRKAPLVIEYIDADARDAFNTKFDITFIKRQSMLNKHDAMLNAAVEDPYAYDAKDTRSIAEIYNLEEHDPWDNRTDEEKEAALAHEKAYDEAKKRGDLSGDSFGSPETKKEKEMIVTDVRITSDSAGNIEVKNVLAVKGFYDEAESEDVADEEMVVDTARVVSTFHKVEVLDAKLVDIYKVTEAASYNLRDQHSERDTSIGCWVAFIRKFHATELFKILEAAGMNVDMFAVNADGERLAPKGVNVITEVKPGEEHPRPWNFRSKEISKMSTAEKKENIKNQRPDEFIFVGNYEGPINGTIVHITPLIYFREHNEMWAKPLNIEHILPVDLQPIPDMPGVYRSKSRRWENICFDLNNRGFRENPFLQLYLNNSARSY